jgi:hypothetical protein
MVNYIGDRLPGDNSFGGALAVSAQGELVASLPLMKEGALLVDLGLLGRRRPANCARAGGKAHLVRG